jgi:hypothetical protein
MRLMEMVKVEEAQAPALKMVRVVNLASLPSWIRA